MSNIKEPRNITISRIVNITDRLGPHHVQYVDISQGYNVICELCAVHVQYIHSTRQNAFQDFFCIFQSNRHTLGK
jgi:hypothetical protein